MDTTAITKIVNQKFIHEFEDHLAVTYEDQVFQQLKDDLEISRLLDEYIFNDDEFDFDEVYQYIADVYEIEVSVKLKK